jgi:hypothetical protein
MTPLGCLNVAVSLRFPSRSSSSILTTPPSTRQRFQTKKTWTTLDSTDGTSTQPCTISHHLESLRYTPSRYQRVERRRFDTMMVAMKSSKYPWEPLPLCLVKPCLKTCHQRKRVWRSDPPLSTVLTHMFG